MREALTITSTVALVLGLASAGAAETYSGEISDSMCRAKHEAPSEGGPELSAKECTNACVRGGSKYVLLAGEDVLVIANQDYAGLEAHAGTSVVVTGHLDGDALTVTEIAPAEN